MSAIQHIKNLPIWFLLRLKSFDVSQRKLLQKNSLDVLERLGNQLNLDTVKISRKKIAEITKSYHMSIESDSCRLTRCFQKGMSTNLERIEKLDEEWSQLKTIISLPSLNIGNYNCSDRKLDRCIFTGLGISH